MTSLFEWIKFIGEFIAGMFHGVFELFTLFGDGVATITAAAGSAPSFLAPILTLTLSVAIIMWVVNLF